MIMERGKTAVRHQGL